jgi:hypothetical protein
VTPACCSIALGDEVLALDGGKGLRVDLQDFMQRERARVPHRRLAGIKIVTT